MNQMEAIATVENRFKKLNFCLNAVKDNFAIEEIHEYRIAIKKLKALLQRLEKGLSPGTKFKLTRCFRKFYKALGRVRNLQLQQKRIADMVTGSGVSRPFTYEQMLESTCREEIKKAKKIIANRKSFIKDEKNIFTVLKENYMDTNGWTPLSPKATSLLKLCTSKEPDETALHGFRKSLKNYLYNLSGKGSSNGNGRSAWITYKPNAKLLADWLGEYRDFCTGLVYLQPAYLKNLPEEEKILLGDIKRKWTLEKENIKQKIFNTLNSSREISNNKQG